MDKEYRILCILVLACFVGFSMAWYQNTYHGTVEVVEVQDKGMVYRIAKVDGYPVLLSSKPHETR